MIWELVFMLVILKIPVLYLCAVVWWAIRAEPYPLEHTRVGVRVDPPSPCDWRRRRGPRRTGPRGGRLVRGRSGAAGRMRGRRTVGA